MDSKDSQRLELMENATEKELLIAQTKYIFKSERNLDSIKKNVQFIVWITIIGIVLAVISALSNS